MDGLGVECDAGFRFNVGGELRIPLEFGILHPLEDSEDLHKKTTFQKPSTVPAFCRL